MKILIILLLFFASVIIEAKPTSPTGLGAIGEVIIRTEGVFFPKKEIDLYDNVTGGQFSKSGYTIGFANEDQEGFAKVKKGELCIKKTSKGNKKISGRDFIELNYEGQYLKYYKIQNGFLKILKETVYGYAGMDPNDPENGFYIRISDIEKLEFKPMPWNEKTLWKKLNTNS